MRPWARTQGWGAVGMVTMEARLWRALAALLLLGILALSGGLWWRARWRGAGAAPTGAVLVLAQRALDATRV